jgi:hypothetical protein
MALDKAPVCFWLKQRDKIKTVPNWQERFGEYLMNSDWGAGQTVKNG